MFSFCFLKELRYYLEHAYLAEFWMMEPVFAFADIMDDLQCAEDCLKYCVRYVYENRREDLEWFQEYAQNC